MVLLIPEARDISDRRRLEAELLQVTQDERRRIGQDLHDTLGQNLTGIAFLVKSIQKSLRDRGDDRSLHTAREIEDLANQTTVLARSLAQGLCPVEPTADGLMGSLEEMARNVTELFGIDCQFRCRQPVLISSDVVAAHLYYIAQEAVNNAIKHGKAGWIVIGLIHSSRDDRVRLSVKDDGAGLSGRPKSDGTGAADHGVPGPGHRRTTGHPRRPRRRYHRPMYRHPGRQTLSGHLHGSQERQAGWQEKDLSGRRPPGATQGPGRHHRPGGRPDRLRRSRGHPPGPQGHRGHPA